MSIEKQRKMKGSLKKFDKNEHQIYDKKGKDSFLDYLKKEYPALKSIENPNVHGIDILSLNDKNEVVFCWEIEVRHGNWSGDIKFPFKEINCIERKDYQWRRDPSFIQKIPFQLAKGYKVFYVQLNKECSRAVIIEGDIILQYPLIPWKNRKSTNEFVRQVPVFKTQQIVLFKEQTIDDLKIGSVFNGKEFNQPEEMEIFRNNIGSIGALILGHVMIEFLELGNANFRVIAKHEISPDFLEKCPDYFEKICFNRIEK